MSDTEARLKSQIGAVSIAERRSVCEINMFDIESRQLFVELGKPEGVSSAWNLQIEAESRFWRELQKVSR